MDSAAAARVRHATAPGTAAWTCLAAPLAVLLLSALALVWLARDGWPGAVGTTGIGFCEALRPGPVKQPANTWSNLGFVAVGLAAGALSLRDRARGAPPGAGRMRSATLFPASYAAAATFLGPGSMAMHASTTPWGGRVDVYSMFLFAAWVVAFGAARLWRMRDGAFAALYAALAGALAVVHFGGWNPVSGSELFGALLVVYAGLELAILRRRPELRANRLGLALAFVAFAAAFAVWLPSRTGGPLCDPLSLVQGHAVWHLLNAVSVAGLYAFYRSERVGSPSRG